MTAFDDPSGAKAAQAAHDAGAVLPTVELPTCEVHLEFRVHGTESAARAIATVLENELVELDDVLPPITSTVRAHE